MALISKDEIYIFILNMMTEKQREFIESYYKMNRVRKDVAVDMGISIKSVERHIQSKLIKLAIYYKDVMENEIKFNRKIDPEWLQSEVRDLYEATKNKYTEIKDEATDTVLNKLEANMQTYLKQLTDLEYKFGEQFKGDVINLSTLKPEEQLEMVEQLARALRRYIQNHKWEVK